MSRLEIPEPDLDDIRDAALFRFWIRTAEIKPMTLVNALFHCRKIDDYRKALYALALSEGVNLP